MKKSLVALLLILGAVAAVSQTPEQGERRRNLPPGETVIGKVTAVTGDSVTVTPLAGGDPVTIKVNGNTRVMKDREPAKLADVKVNDTVFARGSRDSGAFQAMVLGVVNPEMIQRLQQGGFGQGMGGGGGQEGFNREDLGKKFIAGEVKAINETKLTIARPDSQTQDIEVDESTSFRKGNESVTLADIKVGDFVFGRGEIKNGTFIPKDLNVGRGRVMMFGPGGPPPSDQKKPENAPPPKN